MPKPKTADRPIQTDAIAPTKKVREPLADAVNWEEKILRGSWETAIAAMQEAGDQRDSRAIPAMMRFIDSCLYPEDIIGTAHGAVVKMGKDALGPLVEMVQGRDPASPFALDAIAVLAESGVDCTEAAPKILASMPPPTVETEPLVDILNAAIGALGDIGDKGAVIAIKEIMAKNPHIWRAEAESALEKLGLSKAEISAIPNPAPKERPPDPRDFLSTEFQMKAYDFIMGTKHAKIAIFEKCKSLDGLRDRQAWITVNEPVLAGRALEIAMEKVGSRRGALDNVLKGAVGLKCGEIDEAHLVHYADEILDAVALYAKSSGLDKDAEMGEVLSKIRHGGEIKLRFMKREPSDLSLGDKCGDCTAKGSINFGNSVTCLVNPAYQILRMQSGKRFIGRLNVALGEVDGEESIIIDATEFNPQTEDAYYGVGKECFAKAIEFLRELAKKQGRRLYALGFSNSMDAEDIYVSMSTEDSYVLANRSLSNEWPGYKVLLTAPKNEVKGIVEEHGFRGRVHLYYQCLTETGAMRNRSANPHEREKNRRLENEVLNPAQIGSPEVAAAMRGRDFAKAAALILADGGYQEKVRGIFQVSPEYGISPKLLEGRMKEIYPENKLLSKSYTGIFWNRDLIPLA